MNLNDPVIFGMLIKGLTALGLIVVGLALIVSGHLVRKDRTKVPTMAKVVVTKFGSFHVQSSSIGVIIICFGGFTALGAGWAGISKIEVSQNGNGTTTKVSEQVHPDQTRPIDRSQATKKAQNGGKAKAAVFTSTPKEKTPGEWITTVTIVEDEGKELTSYEVPLKSKEDNGPIAMAVGKIVITDPKASPIKAFGLPYSLTFGMSPETSYVVKPDTAEAVKAQFVGWYGVKRILLPENDRYRTALQELNENYFNRKGSQVKHDLQDDQSENPSPEKP